MKKVAILILVMLSIAASVFMYIHRPQECELCGEVWHYGCRERNFYGETVTVCKQCAEYFLD